MNLLDRVIPGEKHRIVYELIRQQDVISKIHLLEQTKWSVSTMTRTLEELCQQQLILEAGLGDSTGGRRPILYTVNPTYGYVFGLEISRTNAMLIMCDMSLNKLVSKRWTMTEEMTPDIVVGEVVNTITNMMSELNIDVKMVIGLGVGAVGPLDRMQGSMINPLNFPSTGWSNVPIQHMLEERLSIPVVLDNGANMAILGEHWSSRNEGCRHLIYIHAGVGLRSAVMTDGKIVYGAADIEDSIGQMIIQTDGPYLSENSNYGSLDTYATIYAIEQHARAKLKQGCVSVLLQDGANIDHISFPQLVQALREDDPLMMELFKQTAEYLGIGLSNIINVLHPQRVILGGPLINAHPMVYKIATMVAIGNIHFSSLYHVDFSLGNLGEEAIVTGAAAAVIKQMTSIVD